MSLDIKIVLPCVRRPTLLLTYCLFVICISFFCPCITQAQISELPDVNISKKLGDDRECAIAQNPTNKDQLFVLCMTSNNSGGFTASRSVDGGTTWTTSTIADGTDSSIPKAYADPSVTWDTFGNLFASYLTLDTFSVGILLSIDGGVTFTKIDVFGTHTTDQPTIVATPTSANGAPVAVWVVWNEGRSDGLMQMRARGAAVHGIGAVDPLGAQHDIPTPFGCTFGDVAIFTSGTVIQACQTLPPNCMNVNSRECQGQSSIVINIKPDGLGPGEFRDWIEVTKTNVGIIKFIPAQSNAGIDAEAGLAIDSYPQSPTYNRIYLVYTDEIVDESDDTDIFIRYSDDSGANWSSPKRVNDDALGSGHSQFFPRIAVSPASGNLLVCWLDTRNDPNNVATETFCTIAAPSSSALTFLPNKRVSDNSSISTGPHDFGDYMGMVFISDTAHPVWADSSNSTTDNPDGTSKFDAYTDRVTGGNAASEGEPHLTTLDGVYYDFQSAGEFIALRSNGLEIQTRQTAIFTPFPGSNAHTGLATCVSLNSAVAARVGAHRITYQPNIDGVPDPRGLQLRVDGELKVPSAQGIDLGSGGRVIKPSIGDGIEIDFQNGTYLYATPRWWPSQSKWYMNVNVYGTTATEGIMGVIAPGSWLPALPNGKSLGPMPIPLRNRYVDLNEKFADAWRVTAKTSLFDYAPGTSTDTFTRAEWPFEKPPCDIPMNLPTKAAESDVARKYCGPIVDKHRHDNCMFDVTATGEIGFAETYLLTERIESGATATNVRSEKDDTQVQESATFIATVAKTLKTKGIPTGTVQFILDGSKVGPPIKLNSSGQAIWKTDLLSIGKHRISASYIPSDDSEFLSSSSFDKLHSVVKALGK